MSQCAGLRIAARASAGMGETAARASESIFSAALGMQQLIISRSRALVIATYRSRSSSLSCSRRSRFATAFRAMVGYSIPRSASVSLGPRPSSGWTSTAARRSDSLKLRLVSARKTTGNSRPLLWCMLIMRTASLSAALGRAGSRPAARVSAIHSLKRRSPRQAPLSNLRASSMSSSSLRALPAPSGRAAATA